MRARALEEQSGKRETAGQIHGDSRTIRTSGRLVCTLDWRIGTWNGTAAVDGIQVCRVFTHF